MMLRFLPWVACGILAALAFFLRFCVPGYSFSALVCCVFVGIIGFYTLAHSLYPRFPEVVTVLRRIFTACLCVGLGVVAMTEAVIIRYSFGGPNEDVDQVIVLGAKVWDSGPSVSLWDRIYAAADYLKANPEDTVIVSGGQGLDEPISEALCMKYELEALGIEPERIILEDKATSTWENLNYSLDLIEEMTGQRPKKIGVLSSEYHLFRASLFARECGVEFVGIPAKTSRLPQKINHFMREVAGVWHFLILGGQYD